MYKNNFICAIKHKGMVLREFDEEVRLPFGSQYSILLKNKDSRRALVEIEVDGENVLSGNSLIIDGHTSQEIKGFMRNMSVTNRFKFIHKTKEISDYRGDRIEDGLIRITYTFQKEKKEPVMITKMAKPYKYPDNYPDPKPWPERWPYPDIKYGASNATCCSDYSGNAVYVQEHFSDEGITVKGAKVTQNYQYGDIDELECATYVITLKLKGMNKRSKKIIKKPLTVKTKLQCSTCGRRSKSSATFCSNCGTYLR